MPAPVAMSVRTDFFKLEAKLSELEKKQLPFAASQAVNALTKQALADIVEHMQQAFDRPEAFTLRGFYARLGNKSQPEAFVAAREFAGKGTPAAKFLSAEILGGARHQKRFEKALGYRLRDAVFVMPGRGAKLDQYGNISNGQINKVLSALGAAETHAGYKANRTTKSAARHKKELFFVATSKKDGKPLAVYQVVGKGRVIPVFIFPRKAPAYQRRLPFYEIVDKSVEMHKAKAFDDAMAHALSTAK